MSQPTSTPAAVVRDVTMRFREHTALCRRQHRHRAGRHHRPARTQRRRQDHADAAAHRPPGAHQRPRRGVRPRPYENDATLQPHLLHQGGAALPRALPGARRPLRRDRSCSPTGTPTWPQSLLEDFDLPAKRPIKKLSRGMNSAVGIIIGLASRAPVTLFDEPYLGLDAVARQLFYDRLLADYAEHPRTVVLSTHLIEEIAEPARAGPADRPRPGAARRGRRVAAGQRPHRDRPQGQGGRLRRPARAPAHRDASAGTAGRSSGSATVRTATDAAAAGLSWEPTSLQQLVVAMSLQHRPAGSGHPLRRPRGGHPMNRVLAAARHAGGAPGHDPRHPLARRRHQLRHQRGDLGPRRARDEPGAGSPAASSRSTSPSCVVFVQAVTQLLPFAMGVSLSRRTYWLGVALVAASSRRWATGSRSPSSTPSRTPPTAGEWA